MCSLRALLWGIQRKHPYQDTEPTDVGPRLLEKMKRFLAGTLARGFCLRLEDKDANLH